jgi:K+-sensing histidine kinase KdpD
VYDGKSFLEWCIVMTDPQTRAGLPESKATSVEPLTMLTRQKTWQWRYGVACCIVLMAFLLRLSIFGSLDHRIPFGFFLLAVMIVAWYGGLGPGLFAAALGFLLASYFFLPRPGPTGALGEAERTSITVFVISSTLVSFLMDNLHSRIRKLTNELNKSAKPPDPSHHVN